jgi:hypothetical protein
MIHHIETEVYILNEHTIPITNKQKINSSKGPSNNNTAVSDARPSLKPEMALLGNPSARFPNACLVSSPHRHRSHCRPSTASLDRARPSSSCCWAGWPCAMRCPRMRCECAKERSLSQPLSVAPQRPSPATKYRSLSPSLCLSPFLPSSLSSLHAKPSLYHLHTTPTRISQCLPAAPARERTRRRSSSSFLRTATPRARRSKCHAHFHFLP